MFELQLFQIEFVSPKNCILDEKKIIKRLNNIGLDIDWDIHTYPYRKYCIDKDDSQSKIEYETLVKLDGIINDHPEFVVNSTELVYVLRNTTRKWDGNRLFNTEKDKLIEKYFRCTQGIEDAHFYCEHDIKAYCCVTNTSRPILRKFSSEMIMDMLHKGVIVEYKDYIVLEIN